MTRHQTKAHALRALMLIRGTSVMFLGSVCASTGSACGDNETLTQTCVPELEFRGPYATYCVATFMEATRTSGNLVLTQEDYDAAYARLYPVWTAAEVLLRTVRPDIPTRSPLFGRITLSGPSKHVILAAIAAGQESGNPTLDALIADLPISSMEYSEGEDILSIYLASPISNREFSRRMPSIEDLDVYGDIGPEQRGGVSFEGGECCVRVATINLAFGVDNEYLHSWEVTTFSDGRSTLRDLGGDSGLALASAQLRTQRLYPDPPPLPVTAWLPPPQSE